AHIDHGKSTLADRLLEATGTVEKRLMKEQILDSNPIERERGITIKLAPVRMIYKIMNDELKIINKLQIKNEEINENKVYILNLIDTPGHVDFSYEVSRSLAACEGVLLVVDATQGIQAQTVAHMQLVKDKNLKVIPVVNKIDLPTAKVEEAKKDLVDMFGFAPLDIVEVSAKHGTNIDKLLAAIVEKIPPPQGDANDNFRALVFSSQYNTHRGVIVYVRIIDGSIALFHSRGEMGRAGGWISDLKFFATGATFKPIELGIFAPNMKPVDKLVAGEVGYIATGLKDLSLARVGDTISLSEKKVDVLPGYKEPKQMVYLSLFPVDNDDFLTLRESLEKLHLSDSSFTFRTHSSPALGKGFTCGFLGLLHGEVVKERLENEFGLSLITTAPTVEYQVKKTDGSTLFIYTPEDFPNPTLIAEVLEPVMYTTIFTPKESVGSIMQLAQDKRADFVNLEYFGEQGKFTYIIPLSEMIFDFFDKLKSISSGYASLDYELYEKRKVDAVKLEIQINKKVVDAFSQIVVRKKVQTIGNLMVEKLRNLIPRHQFQIPIQAIIGGKIIARSDVKSFRKDVTSKLYGGDQSRKDKLLDAQKKGKKRLKQFGNVNIPQEVFLSVYK
ncbi:elongation factor 4, partial [Candidatus Gottesmanbacteria bacterium]|nr:elongation factor 4 [Candidatus Gottesmanbacteria bacterium]